MEALESGLNSFGFHLLLLDKTLTLRRENITIVLLGFEILCERSMEVSSTKFKTLNEKNERKALHYYMIFF